MTEMPGVLVVNSDPEEREAIAEALSGLARVRRVPTSGEAQRAFTEERFDAVLCDHHPPDGTGLLQILPKLDPGAVGVLVCPEEEAEGLLEASGYEGVEHVVSRPGSLEALRITVRSALRLARYRRSSPEGGGSTLEHIAHSPESPLTQVCDQIRQLARHEMDILIAGETGTGKELFAQALHTHSSRSSGPFVAQSCAALPEDLLETELFGHRKGAFTGAHESRTGLFEQAQGGTLFLDEIGEMSLAFQTKLLRVLQERELRPVGGNTTRKVDCRVVSATNRDLGEDMRTGRFRDDLFYRLATVEVNVPPLRERPEDIPLLAGVILEDVATASGIPTPKLPEETIRVLQFYDWPGNVRELENEIRRLVALADGGSLSARHLSPRVGAIVEGDGVPVKEEEGARTLQHQIYWMEDRILRAALARHSGNKTRAAKELGLSRVGLRSKLERHALSEDNTDVAD